MPTTTREAEAAASAEEDNEWEGEKKGNRLEENRNK
jgi:hypothetical protein